MHTSLGQDLAIQGVTIDDSRALQLFSQLTGTRGLQFNQLDLGIGKIGFDFPRQHHTDTATTGNHHRTRLRLFMPKGRHGAVEMRGIANKIDPITNLHRIRTGPR